jgi:uncharacterized Zn finger protein (UPF0148 family)
VASPAPAAPNTWTCTRCEVTVSFSPDVEDKGLPETWIEKDGDLYCLSCRRDMAGDASLEGVDEDVSSQKRLQIRSHARIEFEIKRDPSREDNRIAKACGTSTFAVRKARARLGMDSQESADD